MCTVVAWRARVVFAATAAWNVASKGIRGQDTNHVYQLCLPTMPAALPLLGIVHLESF